VITLSLSSKDEAFLGDKFMSEITRYSTFPAGISSLFDNFFYADPFDMSVRTIPAAVARKTAGPSSFLRANTYRNDDNFVIEVAVPGVNKNNIDVNIEGSSLVISSNTRGQSEDVAINYTSREFEFTSFERSFRLPRNVNGNDITASYDSGILTVTVPIVNGESGRRINID
jgi:HSP20 family protein